MENPTHSSETHISRTYQLIEPGKMVEETKERTLKDGEVIIEPALSSICHADLRYFTGNRRPEALAEKLPMALIHEGIGKIIDSKATNFKQGQRVVVVPNVPGYLLEGIKPEECCPACSSGNDNYCHRGHFLASGVDGIAQSRLVMPAPCVIPIPDEVPDEIAVLSELCTVSYQAVKQVSSRLDTASTAVFGDGPVGYLTAAVLHHMFNVPKERLLAFGAVPDKLEQFQFAKQALVTEYNFAEGEKVDIAIECTGGRFSADAINQAIQILNPGGVLILMGVTEDLVPINTRDVLEKGITMIGSSRSCYHDYTPVITAKKDPAFQKTLKRLLNEEHAVIRNVEDFKQAMDEAAAHRSWHKTLLDFKW